MAISLQLQVKNYQIGELKRLGISFQRPVEVLNKIAIARRDTFEFKFRHELDANYQKTKPLTARYKREKQKKYPGKLIREATGAFRASYKVNVYQRSIREEITDPKTEFIQSTRPILPTADNIPQNEIDRIDTIANNFFKKIGFK